MPEKSIGNRTIERNHRLVKIKAKAKQKPFSPEGMARRKQRYWDVEALFGNIKQNVSFKRFMLRAFEK